MSWSGCPPANKAVLKAEVLDEVLVDGNIWTCVVPDGCGHIPKLAHHQSLWIRPCVAFNHMAVQFVGQISFRSLPSVVTIIGNFELKVIEV